MRYATVCSGIEAATVAWASLGWDPVFFSETANNPRRVLSHHYPNVDLHGDFTKIETSKYSDVQLLAGGTPCQSFSVAGKRLGMDDPRGELSIKYVELASKLDARWLVWENVPGVLSTNGGRDFGAFVSALVECGYGIAYRVLDAQFFGVPQRRRRVVLVGYRGNWRRAFAALFERESVRGNYAKGRRSGAQVVGTITTRTGVSRDNFSAEAGHLIVDDEGFPRWLTAVECERLMGLPENYTNVPNVAYSQRYAMIGNSWAVPVFKWLGMRIDALEKMFRSERYENH